MPTAMPSMHTTKIQTMKKILIIIALLLPLTTWAQDDEKKKKKDEVARLKDELKAVKQEMKDTVSFFNDSIASLHGNIAHLNDSIARLDDQFNDSIARLDKRHAKELSVLNDSIKELNKSWMEEAELREELAIKLVAADKKLEALNALNDIIYRQCLLYPMEGRYNANVVDEAKQCLIGLGLWQNDDYKDMKKYRDLLDNYGRYNEEIIGFMEGQANILKKKGWLLNNITTDGILKDMEQLGYYRFYKDRNNGKYESIIYLDDVLDSYIKLISTNGTITEESYQKIIDDLKP